MWDECFNRSLLLRLLNPRPLAILIMIASFRHKGLRRFFETGNMAGIQPAHSDRIRHLFYLLGTAKDIPDMDMPGLRLHALKGVNPKRWSVYVSGNWRVTFEFSNGNVYNVNYEDYH